MTDWAEIEAWDRQYYLHNTQSGRNMAYAAIDRQEGNWLVLPDGARLLDFQSQLISHSLGHGHPSLNATLHQAIDRYGHVFFGLGNEYRARAAKLIIEDIAGASQPRWASRVRILASGTEAVENAITMARLYTGRQLILTQAHSFHGSTVGASMLRGYRNNITPHANDQMVRDVPGFPAAGYLPVIPPERSDFAAAPAGQLPSLAATEALIRAVGPENIAAVVTEPMFGAAGLFPHPDYLPGLHALARKYGFLWIDDEVLCGFGRLGEWFGYQLSPGIHPDIMAVGKSMNGSILPSGAVIVSKEIGDFLDDARWWSGSTWDGHPLIAASIVGALEAMLEDDMLAQIRSKGVYLRQRLDRLRERHPSVGHVGGSGLYHAVDLVDGAGNPIIPEDRWTAFLGDTSGHPNNIVAMECAARGVFLGGFVPNTIKVGPPFTITEEEMDLGLAALDAALSVVDERYC